ncbi:MAG: 3-phosphoshikimate 1-carboxyvinyltransferase [Archangium sp.]|nr:3-phosphoshikimate 1-carboxyvinyltransferase [Archangium sp.]MDP3576280.1 3-phosphoshikimate 1-carboxyvinyltransferase [Archangium sp.]
MKPPISKSDAQRALVLADILNVPFSEVLPEGEALPRDVEVLRDGLIALRQPTARIDCHDGGAPFRFLLTQAAVLPGRRVEFVGTQRLGERPHGPLMQALRVIPGLRLTAGSPWPVIVESPSEIRGPISFNVTGVESSQFASSLLLGAARLKSAGVAATVEVSGAMTSGGYFELTRSWVERCSALSFPAVPGDWSSLGYLLALSWVSGARVERIGFGTGHPDEAIAELLRGVGLTISDRVEGVATAGFEVDCERCPDAIPTLAAIATRLPTASTFRRAGILRHKESDRLAGVQELLTAAGLSHSLAGEDLTVLPGSARSFRFDAHDDHRLAMSAAVLARLQGVRLTLRGMGSVAKSFPDFWLEAAEAGVQVEAWT